MLSALLLGGDKGLSSNAMYILRLPDQQCQYLVTSSINSIDKLTIKLFSVYGVGYSMHNYHK